MTTTIDAAYINSVPTGNVFIRHFDQGIIETMGAKIIDDDYFLSVKGVIPPLYPYDFRDPSLRGLTMPGIPVIMASPDDITTSYVLPCIVVRRESIEDALSRWPSYHLKYRAPAPGASAVNVEWNGETLSGYDKYEEQQGGFPYDITYMISVLASGKRAKTEANTMLQQIQMVYRPKWSTVTVIDTIGEARLYEAMANGPAPLDEVLDIVDRQAGFSLNVIVQGELDQFESYIETSGTSININYNNGLT